MTNRIISLGLFLLLGTVIVVTCQMRELASDNESLLLRLQDASDQVHTWRAKDGTNRAEIASLAASRTEIEKAFEEKFKAYQDKMRSRGSIESITEVSTETSQGIVIPIVRADTNARSLPFPISTDQPPDNFYFSDGWAEINGVIIGDDLHLQYSVRDSLSIVEYWKKTGFMKKELTLQVINHNPNTQVVGLKNYSVQPDKNKWSIGIGIYYGVSPSGPGPFIGAGIQRSLISF